MPGDVIPPSQMVNPMWRTRRWLEQCENKIDEEEIECWPLIHPLTDGSDAAVWTLVWGMLAVWHWMVKTSRPLICPALTILNIGQFLDEDVERCRWDIQDWVQAYVHAL